MSLRLSRAIVIAALCSAPISAIALPSFSSVLSGSASFNAIGNSLTIQTIGDTTIAWGAFLVDPGETVTFLQSGSQYQVFNSVISAPAQIYGSLSSNGGISLDAPAGILLGSGGMISAPSISLFSDSFGDIILSGNLLSIGDPPGPLDPINSGGRIIVSAVPEPETYSMVLAGLGILGFMARRWKQKAAV